MTPSSLLAPPLSGVPPSPPPRGVSRAPEKGHVGGRGGGEGAGHVVEGGVTNIQVSSSEQTFVCFLFNISTRLVGGISSML